MITSLMNRIKLLAVMCFTAGLTVLPGTAQSQEAKVEKPQENKPVYKFGGMIDFKVYTDSYKSRTYRNDLIYFFPLAPKYNAAGEDLNKVSTLNMSIFSSRLNFSVSNFKFLNAEANAYVEGDFLGANEAGLQMFSMRHIYLNLKWGKNALLLGQTNHPVYIDEVSPNTIAFAAGLPYYFLNRAPQIRYTRKINDQFSVTAAAVVFSLHNTVGPVNSQTTAMMPDMQVQLKYGANSPLFIGLNAGYKLLKPRQTDAAGTMIDKTVGSYNVSAFAKATTKAGYTFKLWGIYGENLTMLLFPGGYGKLLQDNASGDYDYSNIRTFSSWADFETPILANRWRAGIFAAYQKNLGSSKELDLTKDASGNFSYGFFRDAEISWFSKIAPRVEFIADKKLIFALEYALSHSQWSKSYDKKFQPVDLYPTQHNHRVELMARFVF